MSHKFAFESMKLLKLSTPTQNEEFVIFAYQSFTEYARPNSFSNIVIIATTVLCFDNGIFTKTNWLLEQVFH